jgi:hypothetical protein
MHQGGKLIGIAVALVLVAGPLLLGLTGLIRARRAPADAVPEPAMPWNWKLTINSALLYALAFNLTFFIQELFLVLPKALTPGLRPTLFHNNHSWEGENPLANLFLPHRRRLRSVPATRAGPLIQGPAVFHLDDVQRILPVTPTSRHRSYKPS